LRCAADHFQNNQAMAFFTEIVHAFHQHHLKYQITPSALATNHVPPAFDLWEK
jgi:hypothetical protein